MSPRLLEYIESLEAEADQIPRERKEKLWEISDSVWARLRSKKPARLTFICTHNSRRSHLCQIWAATLAEYFRLNGLETYSGGTEVTAFNPRAVDAVRRAGFTVENPGGENPRYKVFFDEQEDPLVGFSKRFDDPANPKENFIAVMTCSDADQNCPVVPGTEFRITISYDDPKQVDGTPAEAEVYDRRCRQIAVEMYYMLSQLT